MYKRVLKLVHGGFAGVQKGIEVGSRGFARVQKALKLVQGALRHVQKGIEQCKNGLVQ